MRVVVAAHHLQLADRLAIKFLLPEMLGNPNSECFRRTARACGLMWQIGHGLDGDSRFWRIALTNSWYSVPLLRGRAVGPDFGEIDFGQRDDPATDGSSGGRVASCENFSK